MCGVIGLIYERPRPDLGAVASQLLRALEYRGYDSTGGAFQGGDLEVRLHKSVGPPSAVVEALGITRESGQLFCGQVRWATFGAVTDANAQPHVVRCKTHLYGAHNGNVTNCDELKDTLTASGHTVLSDNDGEMVVHVIEEAFAERLGALSHALQTDPRHRREAMRRAITEGAARLKGSYAAVIVDPVSRVQWALKQGSSLYFGQGKDADGRFSIAASDLSAVLRLTRMLLPLSEGEFVEYDSQQAVIFALGGPQAGQRIERSPVRSRLRAQDAALSPPFATFMEQEIASQEATCRGVVTLFRGGTRAASILSPFLDALGDDARDRLRQQLEHLRDQHDDLALERHFRELTSSADMRRLLAALPEDVRTRGAAGTPSTIADKLISSELGMFTDLLQGARDDDERLAVRLLDVLLEREELLEFRTAVNAFLDACESAFASGGRVYVLCCGSSYHAARSASLFWNELARLELNAVLPGEMRGEHLNSLRDGDVVVAVSQSGETKDVIDVVNDIIGTGLRIRRIAVVNNLNSTLAQEKCDLVIPLRCGPEIAVPATKSFLNQLTVFYCLALELAERRARAGALDHSHAAALARRREALSSLPSLIKEALSAGEAALEEVAHHLSLAPSLHLLATRMVAVALEGALKIREIVLTHAQGMEASEFKHGPNTILGFNTVLGLEQLERFRRASPDPAHLRAALDHDYPLLFITGPDPRDVGLTVSQINTHKIRGAMTVVIAEEHPALREAASRAPANNPNYRWAYIPLPKTGDTLMVAFTAAVVLQRLALKMSLEKSQKLEQLGLTDHGVHPDVPKNVSKSITVD